VGELAASPQRFGERQVVGGLAAVRQFEHGAEDLAMRLAIEIARVEQLDDPVERRVVEQDAPEHELLGLHALGRDPPEVVFDAPPAARGASDQRPPAQAACLPCCASSLPPTPSHERNRHNATPSSIPTAKTASGPSSAPCARPLDIIRLPSSPTTAAYSPTATAWSDSLPTRGWTTRHPLRCPPRHSRHTPFTIP